jgi:signal transduction histidine kinase
LSASQRLASVGTLAAGIVHEVSAPLGAIVTAGESLEAQLKDGSLDHEMLETVLPIINRSAWHAARIVQTLRGYSRRSAPALHPEILMGVMQDALLLMEYQVKSWGTVKLVKDLDPNTAVVMCDRNQIIQVLINLLSNARDAMLDGGMVTLRTRQTPTTAVIEVADQGVGIPPENTDKIFDPFFTTKSLGEKSGLGLGLSIVADIVRAHKGAIEVHSDGPGHGATFTVTLPLAS